MQQAIREDNSSRKHKRWRAAGAANYLPFRLPFLGRHHKILDRVDSDCGQGFASVRKIGNGLYATISDTSKGLQTMCNGGLPCGKGRRAAGGRIREPRRAAFQIETAKSITQVPSKARWIRTTTSTTRWEFGVRSTWDSAVGACGDGEKNLFRVWAVADMEKSAVTAPLEKMLTNAKSELAKKHLQGDLATLGKSIRDGECLPTEPAESSDRSREGPMKLDLGGLTAVIEHYPGHSGTDMIVRVADRTWFYAGDLLSTEFSQ